MTIALFPDGTRVAVYDTGKVKAGRDTGEHVTIDNTFERHSGGRNGAGTGFVVLGFERAS